jgi:catechol 2,3-dioxygenase-like lactoylglutathione lyase family enzyme
MLSEYPLVGFLATSDSAKARAFFEGALGLTFAGEDERHVAFRWPTGRLRLNKTDKVAPPHGTALGWVVPDVRAAVRELAARGVMIERFEGMTQDELGVWSPEPGADVAWFKDPDGNLLSLSHWAG